MKKNIFPFIFALALLADVVGIIGKSAWLQYISKPLIVASLIFYFIIASSDYKGILKKWIVLALVFSLAGDVLLMLPDPKGMYFLFGLSSFLLAHIFYIIFFHRVRMIGGIKPQVIPAAIVVVYYFSLILLLSPWLGEMKLPVRVYGMVISIMFMLAMHMLALRNRQAGRMMMMGALLFVVSDSILAINKFYASFDAAGPLIMITYGMAQWLIVEGAVRYLAVSRKDAN